MNANNIISILIVFIYYINSQQILRKRKFHNNSYLLNTEDKKLKNINNLKNIDSPNQIEFEYNATNSKNDNIFSLEKENKGSFILLSSKLKEKESDDDDDDGDEDDEDDDDDDDGEKEKEKENEENEKGNGKGDEKESRSNNNSNSVPYTALPPPPPPVPPPPHPIPPMTPSSIVGNVVSNVVTTGLKLIGIH
ncbi:asparagine-rich protein [Plasmodium gallinaceum]|uniref:Asparagine-rich protein n=1 Tax=Plasmodium gallinaceum TaxID=5849 RepID=A0A1J1GQH1_PLAGA|nr:asparagine-rich protein [Plasmodium gallinaceum]CRG94538.1 asparagine-rich protein [Plasmodium gallinaceum]